MTTKTKTKPKNGAKNTTSKPKKEAARPKTKQAIIRGLVERPEGASIAELTKATKWQAHSVRAALTGLRKAGAEITRTKDDSGTTRYRVEATGK
jgi:hypothetical protein